MTRFENAGRLIAQFTGDRYAHGVSVLQGVGPAVAALGGKAALVQDASPGLSAYAKTISDSLALAGVKLLGVVPGAARNAPREDVARITRALDELAPDVVVSFGGGSTIDATKAAIVLWNLGGDIDRYFGTGLVTQALQATGKRLTPHVAVQTAASSSAHLTKYSNITDVQTGQKKLIVDDAIVPARAVFDYGVTASAPASLTVDGGLDGISHSLEVLYSLTGKPAYPLMEEVAREGVGLILEYLPKAQIGRASCRERV
jgi:alcohol dehydrogenase